jgi:hypothetical protein
MCINCGISCFNTLLNPMQLVVVNQKEFPIELKFELLAAQSYN